MRLYLEGQSPRWATLSILAFFEVKWPMTLGWLAFQVLTWDKIFGTISSASSLSNIYLYVYIYIYIYIYRCI